MDANLTEDIIGMYRQEYISLCYENHAVHVRRRRPTNDLRTIDGEVRALRPSGPRVRRRARVLPSVYKLNRRQLQYTSEFILIGDGHSAEVSIEDRYAVFVPRDQNGRISLGDEASGHHAVARLQAALEMYCRESRGFCVVQQTLVMESPVLEGFMRYIYV